VVDVSAASLAPTLSAPLQCSLLGIAQVAPAGASASPASIARGLSDPAQGVASWLDTIPAGTCANNEAPMGSTIRVTNIAGESVTCRVVSRGPFVTGRVVDLAKSTFAKLSPISQGLVGVSVTW
jgi:hypothetical protein